MVKGQPDKTVDMIVQMPQSLFQEKDFQNMRYLYRRAYYLANIAAGLREALSQSVQLRFENLNENPLLPVIRIRPSQVGAGTKGDNVSGDGANGHDGEKTGSYSILIIPCAPEGLFPKGKLLPNANNNRVGDSDTPTSFYNSTLKAEESYVKYLRVLARARTQCASFADACILGRTWLEQRGFGSSVSKGGYGHFEWAIMMAILLQTGGRNGKPALSSSLSSAELFKATVQFLASTDFVKKPFVFGTSQRGNEVIKEAGPVMLDVDTELNILFKMSPWSGGLLRYHAGTTLELLNSDATDQFGPTFITKADLPLHMFDLLFEIQDIDLDRSAITGDRQGALWNFSSKAYNYLSKALKDRASLIHIQMPGSSPWVVNAVQPSNPSHVLVGVLFDPANMAKPMEYGPSAESKKEAARFRQFWGERAELRRFKDGSILECVPWTKTSAAGICEEIVQYILKLHLGVQSRDVRFHGDATLPGIDFTPVDKEAFDQARRAFQTLEHNVRSLEGLPLSIRRLAPVGPELRYASVTPPALGFHKGTIPPIDATLSFEVSSRWPENLVAIQETKIEFLLDIDRRLKEAEESVTTSLGRDNVSHEFENVAFLDVVYDNGATFRLRIRSDLEETLLERQAKDKMLHHLNRSAAEETLFNLRWQHDHLPLHTQSIASLCTRLPALSPAIRMTKHWFNSHKLAAQVSEELIELLVVQVFLNPHPWKVPSSGQSGFLRALLHLSRWDWRVDPLLIDFSAEDEDLTPEDREGVRRELQAWRARDPNMNHAVIFAATSHELSGLAYTRNGPSKLAATRMTRLAKAACRLVHDQGVHLDMTELFRPSLDDYDVLLHLSTAQTKRVLRDATEEAGSRHSAFKNLDARTGKVPLPVARHPADVLLGELEAAYEDSLIFFRGARGDAVVGAVWQPKLRMRQGFRVGLPYNFHKVETDDEEKEMVEVNKEAVLLEIARLGGDMIKRIELVE